MHPEPRGCGERFGGRWAASPRLPARLVSESGIVLSGWEGDREATGKWGGGAQGSVEAVEEHRAAGNPLLLGEKGCTRRVGVVIIFIIILHY